MTLVVDIRMESDRWSTIGGLPARIERAIAAAAEEAGVALADEAEVSVLLCDDAMIAAMNRAWRGFDNPTNVLSFPAAAPDALARAPLLGDIVVAFETAEREAGSEAKPLADHVVHLIVHGFLHLLGYDHHDPQDAEAMEETEIRSLARLGIGDPYSGTLPAGGARP